MWKNRTKLSTALFLASFHVVVLDLECWIDVWTVLSLLHSWAWWCFQHMLSRVACCKSNQSLTFLYVSKQTSLKCRWGGGGGKSRVQPRSQIVDTICALCHLIPGCRIILSSKSPQIPRTVVPERPCLPWARRPRHPQTPSPFSPARHSHALIS